jgi:cell cycle arrest protein BUB2
MNALCGAFLSCMTEADAFSALTNFVCVSTPLYWLSSHIGANAGCKLVDQVLRVVDPALADHLAECTPGAYVYAFHCVSSFCSTIRPLSEVVRLWDFLLAFGPHFNVLCVAAQVILLREKLLASDNPKAILDYRVWPRLDAARTVNLAMAFLPLLPADLYQNIARHATDPAVAEAIAGRSMHENTKDLVLGWHDPASEAPSS